MNPAINIKGPWFSPKRVLLSYNKLQRELTDKQKKSKDFKKVLEAYDVAVTLIGLGKYSNREYWMQTIIDSEGTPDIRTCWFDSMNGQYLHFNIHDFEVVTLNDYSQSEDIVDFINRTKLNSKKRYTSYTSILCSVTTPKYIRPFKEVSDRFSKMDIPSNPIIIVGRLDSPKTEFRLCQVHPGLGPQRDFDVKEEIINKPRRFEILLLNRDIKKDRPRIESSGYNPQLTPFDNLNF